MADATTNLSHVYQHGVGHGVDAVIDDSLDSDSRPYCNHGPTLLFERFFKDKEPKRYFACSACRDRKDCSFFQWEDEKLTPGKKLLQQEIKKKLFKLKKPKTQLSEGDIWCYDCACGIVSEDKDSHKDHATKLLGMSDIESPTQFLNPSDGKKFKAQYFFSNDTCQFFLSIIKRLKYQNVICIGTPRLFELIRVTGVSSILLDIDSRFEYFYSSREFLLYNMYNHFFFDKGSREKTLKSFISKCSPTETLIILDPPFGGLLNVLERSLSKIQGLFAAETVPTIMVFPYFLEHHVTASLPFLFMHDYKVAYTNHPSYHNSGAQNRGSPVRIYTNIPGNQFSMPTEDYRFCKICQRYVYKANRHCSECKSCTSKNGRTYVHCNICKACVKPGNTHCETCKSCKPPSHLCDSRNLPGCHICGDLNHKRRDCPSKLKHQKSLLIDVGEKRKLSSLDENKSPKITGKKKRKSLKKKTKIFV